MKTYEDVYLAMSVAKTQLSIQLESALDAAVESRRKAVEQLATAERERDEAKGASAEHYRLFSLCESRLATAQADLSARESDCNELNIVIDELRADGARLDWPMLIHIYNTGYESGHHSTVEGGFIPLAGGDWETYHEEEVRELVAELLESATAAPGSGEKACDTCEGTGKVHSHNDKCWDCGGSGVTPTAPLDHVDDAGEKVVPKRITTRPPSVPQGRRYELGEVRPLDDEQPGPTVAEKTCCWPSKPVKLQSLGVIARYFKTKDSSAWESHILNAIAELKSRRETSTVAERIEAGRTALEWILKHYDVVQKGYLKLQTIPGHEFIDPPVAHGHIEVVITKAAEAIQAKEAGSDDEV